MSVFHVARCSQSMLDNKQVGSGDSDMTSLVMCLQDNSDMASLTVLILEDYSFNA